MIYYFFHKKCIHSLEFKLWVQQMNRKAFISLELHRNAEKNTYIWASCDFFCHADLNRWLSKHGCWYLLSFNTCWRCLQFNCQTEAVIRCKTPVSANILCSNFVAGGLSPSPDESMMDMKALSLTLLNKHRNSFDAEAIKQPSEMSLQAGKKANYQNIWQEIQFSDNLTEF